jgi:hypothetical protein
VLRLRRLPPLFACRALVEREEEVLRWLREAPMLELERLLAGIAVFERPRGMSSMSGSSGMVVVLLRPGLFVFAALRDILRAGIGSLPRRIVQSPAAIV